MLKQISLSAAMFCILTTATQASELIDLKSQIIAEPEIESDYVHNCEAAGPGFKFIPDTQTCIRISGHVRYDINVKSK